MFWKCIDMFVVYFLISIIIEIGSIHTTTKNTKHNNLFNHIPNITNNFIDQSPVLTVQQRENECPYCRSSVKKLINNSVY